MNALRLREYLKLGRKSFPRVFLVFLCILLLLVPLFSSGQAPESLPLGSSTIHLPSSSESTEKDSALGLSGDNLLDMPDDSELMALPLSDPVRFQLYERGSLANKSLELTVAIEGDVHHIQMSPPSAADTTELVEDIAILGQSAESTILARRDVARKEYTAVQAHSVQKTMVLQASALGLSGEAVDAKVQERLLEVPKGETLDTTLGASFSLEEEGAYQFTLFDSEYMEIGSFFYQSHDALLIRPLEGNYFQLFQPIQVQVFYTPSAAGKSETLDIILPTFFLLGAIPGNTPGVTYTYERAHHRDVPYYTENPEAALLLQGRETGEAPTPNLQIVRATIEADHTDEISYTFTMNCSVYEQSLGKMMLYYGANPDRVPLPTIGRAVDEDGVLLEEFIWENTSVLTDDLGNPLPELHKLEISNPDPPETLTLYTSQNTASVATSYTEYWKVEARHYPIYNVKLYFPHYDMKNPRPKSYGNKKTEDLGYRTTMDGVPYWVENYESDLLSNYYSSAHLFNNDYGRAGNQRVWLGEVDTLYPGQEFDIPPTYVSYDFMGQHYDKEVLVQFGKINVKDFLFYRPGAAYLDGTRWRAIYSNNTVRTQGQEDYFRFTLSNLGNLRATTDTLPQLPATYENSTFRLEFPYEIAPKILYFITHYNLTTQTPQNWSNIVPTDITPLRIEYTTHSGHHGVITDFESMPDPLLYSESFAQFQKGVTLPQEHGPIATIDLVYDVIKPNAFIYAGVKTANGTNDQQGNPLPNDKTTYPIVTSLITESGKFTQGYGTNSPVYHSMDPLQHSTTFPIVLQSPGDGLQFGTNLSYSNNPESTVRIRTSEDQPMYRGDRRENNRSDGGHSWTFSLKNALASSKDYADATITIEGVSPEDQKALSKIRGFETYLLSSNITEKFEVFYKTNKYPNGRLQSLTPTEDNQVQTLALDLATQEYVTALEIRLGTVYSHHLETTKDTSNQGENVSSNYQKKEGDTTVLFDNYRTYFTGDEQKEELIAEGDTSQLRATFRTPTPAQYINHQIDDWKFFNSTSTATITFQRYHELSLQTGQYRRLNISSSTVYTGSIVSLETRGNVGGTATLNGHHNSFSWTGKGIFPTYDHYLYFEVSEGFEFLSLPGYELVDVTPVTGKKSRVFTFFTAQDTLPTNPGYGTDFYVLPNAPIAQKVPIILRGGVSFEPFQERYLTGNAGDDPYYYSEPYYKMSFPNVTTPPSDWNIGNPALFHNFPFLNTEITVDRSSADRVTVNTFVDGQMQSSTAKFQEHQKENLSANGWFMNISDRDIQHYYVRFQLPRTDIPTLGSITGGVPSKSINRFDMYLRGPISFLSTKPPNYTVTYLDTEEKPLDLSDSSPPEEWRKVHQIQIYLDEFPAEAYHTIAMPLTTDYTKKGKDTYSKSAYFGAASSKEIKDTPRFAYIKPEHFSFESYEVRIRMGLDNTEEGKYGVTTNNVGLAKAYYYDDAGQPSLLSTYTAGFNPILINQDVAYFTVEPIDSTRHHLTKDKYYLYETEDSDFPRPPLDQPGEPSKLVVTQQDLIDYTHGDFDAGFITLPRLSLEDIVVLEDETNTQEPKIYSGNTQNPPEALRFYQQEIAAPTDTEIATNELLYGDIVTSGHKAGRTYFDFTIINRLGDRFTTTNIPITVLGAYGTVDATLTGHHIWEPHGHANPVLRLEGKSYNAEGRVFYASLPLVGGATLQGEIEQAAGTVFAQQTLERLPVGIYEITLLSPDRYHKIGESTVTIEILGVPDPIPVTFTLQQEEYKYLSDEASATIPFTIPK